MVPRNASRNNLSNSQLLMHIARSTSACSISENSHHVPTGLAGVGQGVASYQSGAQMKIDVGTSLHIWKRDFWRDWSKLDADDVAGFIANIEDKC